jgi:hypothetical protein
MPRYSFVVLGVALLFSIAAVAQGGYGSSGQSSSSTSPALEGCIVQAQQDYYIYPLSGQPQHISNSGQDVSGHVGHHVKLQGTTVPTSSSSASAPGATSSATSSTASNQASSSATSGSGQDFAVTEVDMVSESCPDSIQHKAAAAGMSTHEK